MNSYQRNILAFTSYRKCSILTGNKSYNFALNYYSTNYAHGGKEKACYLWSDEREGGIFPFTRLEIIGGNLASQFECHIL